MNANFVFPTTRMQRPPKQQQKDAASRDSNAIRASVLDVALELGIGATSLGADWMFNNSVSEEDEILAEVRIFLYADLI